jgi:transcription elongation GreA/GreB family factor
MDKTFLVEQLSKKLRALADQAVRTAEETRVEARTGANRAVNLAKGIGQRETAALSDLDALELFRARPMVKGGQIGLGAVVEIESEEGEGGRTLFLAPVGAGQELSGPGGDGFFQVVTPASPVGKAIFGRKVGDVVELAVRGEVTEWTISYAA